MMRSILQKDTEHCYLCHRARGCPEPFDLHHVFGAAYKKESEKYGLLVYLCHDSCHIFGRYAVHQDAETRDMIRAEAQKVAMRRYGWTTDEFIKHFGKNYIEEVRHGRQQLD